MISIIIPVFNAHDMTYECLTAVLENTHGMEITVADATQTVKHWAVDFEVKTSLI